MALQHEWQDRLPTIIGSGEPVPENYDPVDRSDVVPHPGEVATYFRGVERAVVYPVGSRGRFKWWVDLRQYGAFNTKKRNLYAEGDATSEEAALEAADATLTLFERIWNKG